jgi:hypothetical protein
LPNEEGRERIRLERLPDQSAADDYWRFRWAPMPKLLYVASWPVWIDVGERGLLQVRFVQQGRGGGWLTNRQWFIDEVVNGTKLTLRTHAVPSQTSKPRKRGAARATTEKEEDLSEIPVNCTRPIINEPCCGERWPHIQREWLGPSCQLCPQSPTYWRGNASMSPVASN